jgi:hypothetical protein
MGDDSLDIKELDVVRLKNGQEATILEVFQKGVAFYVEIVEQDEDPIWKEILSDDIEKIIYQA